MSRPPTNNPDPPGALFALAQGVVAALIVARLVVPPEGSVFGETLWLTAMWFAATALWTWDALRRGDFRLRVDWLDAAVWAVVLGHVVSAAAVLLGEGDKRAALNMLWEWVALGASFFLLRQTLRSAADRVRLAAVLVGVAAVLAGLGLWQHYVQNPAIAEYEALVRRLESQQPGEQQRALAEMRAAGIPLDEAGRRLFEARLRSPEPLATFALTNTLAGFLAAWWLVGLGLGNRGRHGVSTMRRAAIILVLLAVLYCLLLTRSRTAWVGLLAGSAAWIGWIAWTRLVVHRQHARIGRWLLGGFAVVALIGLLVVAAALSGGLDAGVISGAPKSLRYRLEYWVGTWEVIREYPLLGVGPGNFRPHYLHHKLPGASEEILDPHNAPLDLWVSGGLLALLGAVAAIGIAARQWSRSDITETERATTQDAPITPGWTALEFGAAGGFILAMAAKFLLDADSDPTPLGLMVGWLAVQWLLDPVVRRAAVVPSAAVAAGAIALMVHLLGAGGIEMPAIAQTLLVLAVLGCGQGRRAWTSRAGVAVVGGVGALLLILCMLTGVRPVLTSRGLLEAGAAALWQDGDVPTAVRLFAAAAEADPLSAEPPLRLAELMFQRWHATATSGDPDVREQHDQDFWRAVKLAEVAIERDPFSPFVHQRIGQWHMIRHRLTGEPRSARKAVEAFNAATRRYPHLASLRAERALALDAAGQPKKAETEARFALRLDEINRRRGHRDKELPPTLRVKLRRVLDE